MDDSRKLFQLRLIGSLLVFSAIASTFINGWLASLDRGVWLDEALSAFFIEQSWPGLFTIISEFEANMAIYYVSLKLWASAFPSEVGLRFFSFLTYLSSAIIFVLTIQRVWGMRVGLTFLVLFFGHFFLIRYSVEVRGYTFALLCLGVLWHCWVRASLEGQQRWWMWYAGVGIIAVHAHFYVSLGIFALGITTLVFRPNIFIFKYWLVAHTAIIISFFPILLFIIAQEEGQLEWLETPGIRALIDTAFMYSGAAPPADDWVRRSLLFIFTILSGLSLLEIRSSVISIDRKQSAAMAALITVSLLPVILVFLISQIEPAFSRRFFIPFVPFFLIFIALGIRRLGHVGSLATAGVILALMTASAVSYSHRPYFSWATQSRYMLEQCSAHEGVLFMSPKTQSIFRFYESRENQGGLCEWNIYPYKMSPANYVKAPEQYPTHLDGLDELDTFWIIETHLRPEQIKTYQRYIDQVKSNFTQCRMVVSNDKVTLHYCK